LLAKMGGSESITGTITAEQLDGRAGGPVLKRETTNFGVVEKTKSRASRQLRRVLLDPTIFLPLLVLISQIRNKVLFRTETPQLKFIGNLYDTCNSILTLLIDFMATVPEERDGEYRKALILNYGKMLPNW